MKHSTPLFEGVENLRPQYPMIGIDLGGTKIESVVLSPSGEELFRHRVPTHSENGYDHIIAEIHQIYLRTLASIDNQPHTLGFGTPGSLSVETGLMKNCNTTCLNGKPLSRDLSGFIDIPFIIENDANCFALAESIWGAGRGHSVVFGVILGTGCGGGIVIDQRIWRGPNTIAGEWGHSVLIPGGRPCYCGKRGCVETYISGSGIQNAYLETTGLQAPVEEILDLADQGHPEACEIMDTAITSFALALSNVINILDPGIIVLGGGLSNLAPLYAEGIQRLRELVFSDTFTTRIVANELGDSAGVLGAARLGATLPVSGVPEVIITP